MELTIAPRGVLQINDARIIFKNFRGEQTKYNREGERNFALVIPDEELADILVNEGWNVKIKEAAEEGDTPRMHLPVKIKFNDRGPHIYVITNGRKVKLDEESVGMLDRIYISNVNLDIRPYDWEVNGKTGRTAYLQSMECYQEVDDRFADYDEEEYMD